MTRPTSIGALRSLLESPLATVEDGALIIARDARPGLDPAQTRARLDALADATSARLDRSSTIQEQLAVLADVLFRTAGLRGNRADYNDPRNSYLPDVLERRLGIPISLAVIISAVARRAGVVTDILGFPGHVLVRVGGPNGAIVDPFDRMRALAPGDLRELVRRVLGPSAEVRAAHLEPLDMRGVLVRMLTNLRTIHEQRRDHRGALVVCDRLVELDAGVPARRDRGLHALALGARAAAAADLAFYLSAAPQAPDRVDVERALARASETANWN